MAHDSDSGASHTLGGPISAAFALRSGPVDLSEYQTDGRPIGPKSKKDGEKALLHLAPRLAELQERLFAQGTSGDRRRILLVLQGMDTAGKDGVIKHVIGLVDPGGVHLSSFKQPTKEEQAHDFLWRIERQVPAPGIFGVFNRSQYEDVLIVRVHELVPREVWSRRYAAINAFERRLVRQGVVVIKCFLHVSPEVQRERLRRAVAGPDQVLEVQPRRRRRAWPLG